MELFLALIDAIGALICHQLPERSFTLAGRHLPVCARCTGLYLSGLLGFVGWCTWKVARSWRPFLVAPRAALAIVIAAGIPTAVSYATGIAGVWDGSNVTRALLAVPLGVSAGAVVAAVATKDLK